VGPTDDLFVHGVEDIIDFMKEKTRETWMFRGVTDAHYDLVPSIGRTKRKARFNRKHESLWLHKFQLQTRPHLKTNLSNNLEWLVFAQHHGLPTRLLDWTLSPLVAAYFAVATSKKKRLRNELTGKETEIEMPGAIYAIRVPFDSYLEEGDPFDIQETRLVVPAHVTERITRQSGLLTLHAKPTQAWKPHDLQKMIIPMARKDAIKLELASLGIHEASLFPDVVGIAGYLAWQFEMNLPL
jgi:hypothetical protein